MTGYLWMTVKEYAIYRRVSSRTVERWLSRHELPAERVGRGHWRIRVWRDLAEWPDVDIQAYSAQGLEA